MYTNLTKHQSIIILLIILLSASVIRIIHLDADPPAGDISRSGVFYADEGQHAFNAYYKIKCGSWFAKDDYNPVSNYPVFVGSDYLFFKMFGVRLNAIRLGAIIFSTFSLLIIWFIVREESHYTAIFAVALGAINFFALIFNRLALLENPLLCFSLLVLLCIIKYNSSGKRALWLILAIVVFYFGFFIKATILFLFPILLIAVWKKWKAGYSVRTDIAIVLLQFGGLAILTYFLWIKPHLADWQYFSSINLTGRITASPIAVVKNYCRYFGNLKLFQFMPVMYVIFIFQTFRTFYRIGKKQKVSLLEEYIALWAVLGILFLGFFEYSPPRYSVILLPAVFISNAFFFTRPESTEISRSSFKIQCVLIFIISCVQITFGLYRILIYHQIYPSCFLPLLAVPLIIVLCNKKVLKDVTFPLKGVLAGIIIFIQMSQIIIYYGTAKYSYYNAIQSMKKIMMEYNRERVIVGDIAPMVAIDLDAIPVNINYQESKERDRILRSQPDYLILQENNDLARLREKMPNYFYDVQLLEKYTILNNYKNDDVTYFYMINIPE